MTKVRSGFYGHEVRSRPTGINPALIAAGVDGDSAASSNDVEIPEGTPNMSWTVKQIEAKADLVGVEFDDNDNKPAKLEELLESDAIKAEIAAEEKANADAKALADKEAEDKRLADEELKAAQANEGDGEK